MSTYLLDNRDVISISGEQRYDFLQSLVTNDVLKVKSGSLIYALFLSPQGRFMFDMFVFEQQEKLYCDVQKSRKQELLNKLKMYKMRRDIDLESEDDYMVYYSLDEGQFKDPRSDEMGFRTYSQDLISKDKNNKLYNLIRIQNLIPDADLDLLYLKSLPMDFGLQNLNAIDFEKGCYIGQEVTARMNYRGKLRKTLRSFSFDSGELVKGEEIHLDSKKVGTVLGTHGTNGLGLMYKEGLEILKSKKSTPIITQETKKELILND